MDRAVRSVPGLAAAMTVSMGAGPLIVYAISTLSPFLIPELGLSRLEYGTLGTVTFASAAIASLRAGRVVDTTGARSIMWLLVLGAVGAIFAAAAAPSYPVLLVAVMASGIVQALSNPITNRLAAQWLPPSSRGVVMGVKQSGVQMTQAAAGLFLPTLAVLATWRGALALVAGAMLFLGAVLVARYVPHEPREQAAASRIAGARLPTSVWWLTGFMFLVGAALQGVNFYLPLFGYEDLGLSVETAGLLAAIVGGVGIVARIIWGRITDRAGSNLAMPAVAAGGACALALLLLSSILSPELIWLGALLMGATGVAANVVVMVSVIHAVPSHAIGRATGLVATGMYVGFAAGPISVGALVDGTGSYAIAWAAIIGIYAIAVIAALGFANQARRQRAETPLG